MKYSQRVHIIPIGDDDVDRIVIPAEMGKADRIYLIFKEGENLFADIVEKSRNIILTKRIVKKEDLIDKACDIFDFSKLLQEFAEIIRLERIEKGNDVFFSLSTGGNLLSAAGMLSCMLFGAEPYFLVKDFKENKIPVNPEILPFPKYNVFLPEKSLIQFLFSISEEMRKNGIEILSKKQCLRLMEQLHPNEVFSKTSGDYNKLKFRYLNKLEVRNYIEIENKPRGKIKISPDGEFALKIFSIYYGLET
ncbi:hypothetical protein LCGC14_0604120 [marine sediment metagenome]|uniref:Uncharacterized protein n=1 Tax=marine sediment metagenome TaxID=412755 RepID=A0A0F9UI87_9ZZZZ